MLARGKLNVCRRVLDAFVSGSVLFPPDLLCCLLAFATQAAVRRFRERKPVVVAIHARALPEVYWRVVPLETPRILRHCAKCGRMRRFASSDKFRLNAQQRKVDVWLIYKCLECESTWNCTILSRRAVKEIDPAQYLRFQLNDRELAWSYAFDLSLLSQLGVQVDEAVRIQVVRSGEALPGHGQQGKTIHLELAHPGIIRLDRLLAEQLQVSRSCLRRWVDNGRLLVWPKEKNALRKPARNGQIIYLHQEE